MNERRHFARIGFDAVAQLASADSQAPVRLVDISFKGALVEVPSDWSGALGAPCLLTLRLDGADSAITMSAEVAHLDGRRVGLLCRSIDLDSITHLRQLIELNLGDAALLERELKALVAS